MNLPKAKPTDLETDPPMYLTIPEFTEQEKKLSKNVELVKASITKHRDASKFFLQDLDEAIRYASTEGNDQNNMKKDCGNVLKILTDVEAQLVRIDEVYIPLRLLGGGTPTQIISQLDSITSHLPSKLSTIDTKSFLAELLHENPTIKQDYETFVNTTNIINQFCTRRQESKVRGNRLISIDGGGVRGVCSLLMLQALMKAIDSIIKGQPLDIPDDWNDREESRKTLPKPKDYFNLAGGTSTGGLIAIMLFRLDMPVWAVKDKYNELSRTIFKPGISRFFGGTYIKPLLNRPWFSASKLEDAVKKVLRQRGRPYRERMFKSGDHCKTFVCSVTKRTQHTINLRSWRPTNNEYHVPCNIVQAARATSAAPFYFPPMKIDNITFWDGGLQNNNPIGQVLCENSPGWPAVVVSLGTGVTDDLRLNGLSPEEADEGIPVRYEELEDLEESTSRKLFSLKFVSQLQAVLKFVTNVENQHRSFKRVLDGLRIKYFRLNPTIDEEVDLSSYKKIDDLEKWTKRQLATEEQQKELKDLATLLLRKPLPLDPLEIDRRRRLRGVEILPGPSRRLYGIGL